MIQNQVMKDLSREIGFDAAGVAPAALLCKEGVHLERWVKDGKNAGMGYMANNLDKRVNPALLVEGVKSVIVTLSNYYAEERQPDGVPRIARYAWGKDYHIVVKERLWSLLRQLQQRQPGITGRCFVDSAPVFEHEWARRAGLGWQGKNTLLLNRKLGSFCFIGVIFTDALFERYDEPFTADYCGKCNRCVEACPTGALSVREVDARKCISYQTIENKGDYPEELKRLSGGRIFGCDACQDVCPWNKKVLRHKEPAFLPKTAVLNLAAADWQQMGQQRFDELFKDTALERTGLQRIVRNL